MIYSFRWVLLLVYLSSGTALSKSDTAPAATKQIWDSWYTVTVKKKIKYAYYNDHFEQKGPKIYFQNKFWKSEENYINEEQLGAYAKDDDNLSPDFFNFRSTYRTTETIIDGTVLNGNTLHVRTKKNGKEIPMVKKTMGKQVFFSGFFPLWLGKRLTLMKPGKPLTFTTILEDTVEEGFPNESGWVRLEAPDDFAKKSNTTKLTVFHRGANSLWYVEKNGNPVRIDMTSRGTLVERVSQKEAENFLKNPSSGE
ncbi:hypothetical protein K2X30_08335 [bacterium]|jgi:hypothetical protein|nr:hypothetical protein [bacterium]